jgi:hypothetical protein
MLRGKYMRLAKERPFWTEVFIALTGFQHSIPTDTSVTSNGSECGPTGVGLGRALCHYSSNNSHRLSAGRPGKPYAICMNADGICHGLFCGHLCIDRSAQVG